ncbi:ATP-binding protein [Rubripirellula lacrimiformis]|nr:ATP-binding protein [Rubripirellula lacrimiformis]
MPQSKPFVAGRGMKNELEILLVEDDPDAQANLFDILEMDGHQIRVAGSFGDVRASGLQPDVELVILDRRLPDGNVEDALPELTALLPNAEFIVITGFADIESTIAAFRLGVTDYLLKPVHPDVIRQSVARLARQKHVESELNREQRFANQILDTSEALIVVLDMDGCIVRFNPHFTAITGWTLDDLKGKSYIDHCIPESERDRLRQVFRETATGKHSTGVCNGVLTSDGRIRQFRWSDSTLTDEDGEITSVLAIGIDVTDVVEAQNAAARDHRLAAIGQTVAGLAHESRNALHRINASVEILRLDIPIESESREEVDSIARASSELQLTLEEVRQYAAPIQLHREPVMLHEVWRRVWGYLAKTRGQRDAELIEAPGCCDCLVDVDVMRMEQVFRNLFENSLAACDDPVCIQVDCKCDDQGTVQLDIRDNGPGLCAEQRQKLFEPFYTTKSRGTGLGMSIVQRIIDAHHGDIQVGEPTDRGARFLIRLGKQKAVFASSSWQEAAADA